MRKKHLWNCLGRSGEGSWKRNNTKTSKRGKLLKILPISLDEHASDEMIIGSRGTTMGRIKTQLTKRVTKQLMSKHGEKFTANFEENKKIVKTLSSTTSRRIQNTIAGYAARIKKKE